MVASPIDSSYLGSLFGDAEVGALFSEASEITAMIEVERALARVQGVLGIIPAPAAHGIDSLLANTIIDPAALAAGTASAGVPVPALVEQLRQVLPVEYRQWLHWGATSQDIVDTALVLRLRDALVLLAGALDGLNEELAKAARRWARLPMAGRTRSQIAAPITFGLRIAHWYQPLAFLRSDLEPMRGHLLRVQLGGAVGSNAVYGLRGQAVVAALAEALGFDRGATWHTDRSAIGRLGGWCAGLCAALAKMAGDIILMGRSESGEASAGEGGGSSTMPQKSNPVAAETIVALAKLVASLSGALHLACAPLEERDGAAWNLEWLVLPQMIIATAVALRHARNLAASLHPHTGRLATLLELDGGAVLAEAASFTLAGHMPRDQAQGLVRRAVAEARHSGSKLNEVIRDMTGIDIALAHNPAVDAAEAAIENILRGQSRE